MSTTTVKLAFRGPVHFGSGRLSDGEVTCDAATVFSALFIEALSCGCADDLLEASRAGELEISDAFPYMGDAYYLPKPMVAPDTFDERNRRRESENGKADSLERKANKKLAYVPAKGYADYLAGSFEAIAAQEAFNIGRPYLQTKVNLTRERSADALPYFVGGYIFRKDAGLYLVTRGAYDVVPLFERLSLSGIGGKRTSGYGRFDLEVTGDDPVAQAAPEARTGASVLLSTALPTEDELSDELMRGARYRLVRRGGFVQSQTHSPTPQKRRDQYLFRAGSVFERTFAGDVYDVNATEGAHPVWRYARAMWMGV